MLLQITVNFITNYGRYYKSHRYYKLPRNTGKNKHKGKKNPDPKYISKIISVELKVAQKFNHHFVSIELSLKMNYNKAFPIKINDPGDLSPEIIEKTLKST